MARGGRTLLSILKHHGQIPAKALLIDTVIAAVLLGLTIYHFTQPDQAWRSGCMELFCAALLLTAAYRVSPVKSAFMHLLATIFAISLGSYHLTHGGGWRSGTTELIFAFLLVINALIIFRANAREGQV